MDEQTRDDPKKPHWAWPHVIAVACAILAYFVLFRFTGDADLFYSMAMAGAAWAVSWVWLFPPNFLRRK